MEKLTAYLNPKMNWYKPHTYIAQLAEPTNAYYVGLLLPLPTGYTVQRTIHLTKNVDSTMISEVTIKLMVISAPLNGYEPNESFLWKDEVIIDGLNPETSILVEVESLFAEALEGFREQPQERELDYYHAITDEHDKVVTKNIDDEIIDNEEDIEAEEDIVRGIGGDEDGNDPESDTEGRELGKGTPTKGASADKLSIKFVRKKKADQ